MIISLAILAATLPLAAATTISPGALEVPAIEGVTAPGARLELVAEGFSGTEGPLRLSDGTLLFTENRADRIVHLKRDGSASVYLESTGGANALALARDGDLIAVQTTRPALAVIAPASRARVLADSFEGAPLNRPNDLVIDRRGGVYFTDPGASPRQVAEARAAAGATAVTVASVPATPATTSIYYLPPANSARTGLVRIDRGLGRPNGVTLSPDEQTLYVADTYAEHVYAYDVAADGAVGPRRKFATLTGFRQAEEGPSSGADGLAVDAAGRVYVASTAGVQIFDASGRALGVISTPKPPQNLAFAGDDRRTLYIVGRGGVWKLATLARGPERAK